VLWGVGFRRVSLETKKGPKIDAFAAGAEGGKKKNSKERGVFLAVWGGKTKKGN